MTPTVVCVLRSGGEYTTEHVRALYERVLKWWPKELPFRFVCLTDMDFSQMRAIEIRKLEQRWPTWWAKMEMFAAAHDDLGDILYIDLDTIVMGYLTDIVRVNQLTVLEDFYHPKKVSAGLMYLPKYERPAVYAAWLSECDDAMRRLPGDSDYINQIWNGRAIRWQNVFPGQVVSYKVHVRQNKGQTVPPHARIVCYHGRPRPWETKLWTIE